MATSLDQILGYGRDVAQGASNAVASNVSAPVDGIAWLLKKAGLDVGEPVGGSDWMARKGLTAQPKNALAGLLGESVGMAGPMVAAAKAPQIAAGLNQMAANAAARPTLNPQTGAIVWHGSPHQFDKFDSSKIGTGEGAQAYGHGLYLAESPDVAKSYMGPGTSAGGPAFESRLSKLMEKAQDAGRYGEAGALEELLINRNPSTAYSKFSVENGYSPATVSQAHATIKQFENKFNPAGLYKVDLPDEKIARMLDWDKPLSQQAPEVRALLRKQGISGKSWEVQALGDGPLGTLNDRYVFDSAIDARKQINDLRAQGYYARPFIDGMGKGKTGEDFVRDMADPAKQSERLRAMGIPGIRYLDGGSRNAGTGSSNFVVFPGEENILRILERNGKQLP